MPAYSVPPRWSHGGVDVSAARMNIYSQDILNLLDVLDGYHRAVYPMTTGGVAVLSHRWRWLWYQTRPGEVSSLKDPSGVNADTTLPSNEGSLIAYDLSRVSWLTPGQWYNVTGATHAVEDIDP